MPSVATNTADDVGGEVALVRTIVFAMTDLAAILASLVFVVAEGTVQGGELAELVALKLVLAFGDGSGLYIISQDCVDCSVTGIGRRNAYRFDDIVDGDLGTLDLVFSISHDETVEVFFLIAGVCRIGAAFAFFD